MFLNEEGYENSEGESVVFVTFEDLINQINRVPFPATEAMIKGNNFENDVLLMAEHGQESWKLPTLAYSENLVDKRKKDTNYAYVEVLKEVTNFLPYAFVTQKLLSRNYKGIEFYGKIDFMGAGKIVDTKFTSSYSFPKYKDSFQNLYLWAAQEDGFRSMEYVISNGRQVYHEFYGLDYNFAGLLEQMEFFADFCNLHRSLITDKKIFNQL